MTFPYDAQATARRVPERPKANPGRRTEFQRDRARVLHSSALRRLAAKTQVHVAGEDDFPRTRLTHSLECAQIGRELGAALGCSPDVVDAACLAHDLGHPPFGHNGETALDELGGPCGGFEANAQTLRILTRLEAKVFDARGASAGLNLTRATLDAATKYPWPRQPGVAKFGVYPDDRAVFDRLRDSAPEGRRCLEAQVMDWADDVASSVHDVEDGVHAGLVRLDRLAADAEERAAVCATTERHYLAASGLDDGLTALLRRPEFAELPPYDGTPRAQAALKRLTSEVTGRFVSSVIDATREKFGPEPLGRYAADLVVPDEVRAECALLKGVALRYVMSRSGATQRYLAQRDVIAELVRVLTDRGERALDPALQPAWRAAGSDAQRLRVVIDQVASLTDNSVQVWHNRLVARPG